MKKIEDVVSKDTQGNISGSLLSNSLATKSKRNALYQEDPQLANLARAGKDILDKKMPNSGTFARFLAQNPTAALANAGYHKTTQMAMQNPITAAYIERGLPQGALRNFLKIPANIGASAPEYMAKPGAAGAISLRELINMKNRQAEQEQ